MHISGFIIEGLLVVLTTGYVVMAVLLHMEYLEIMTEKKGKLSLLFKLTTLLVMILLTPFIIGDMIVREWKKRRRLRRRSRR